jgi:hypothetical protein
MAERKSISKTRKPGAKSLVSVVLSFRNEKDVLSELISRLNAVFAARPEDCELVFVNEHLNPPRCQPSHCRLRITERATL